jgi:DNA-binding response OmpR family regulator
MIMKVIICEDDKDITSLMQILLEELSFQVTSCLTTDSFRETVKKDNFDLIILDYSLNGETTEPLIEEIKSDKGLKKKPLVIVSAIKNLEDVAKRLGVRDTIRKPFDIKVFQDKIQLLLK